MIMWSWANICIAQQRRRRAQRRERGDRHDQDEEDYPVRRLVPHRIQGKFLQDSIKYINYRLTTSKVKCQFPLSNRVFREKDFVMSISRFSIGT